MCDDCADRVRSLFDVIYIDNATNVGLVFSRAIDTGTGGQLDLGVLLLTVDLWFRPV